MHAEHRIAREALEQAVVDHALRSRAAFLGWLEDQVHGPVEGPGLRQITGGRQQHRRMAIMAAGMHLSRMRRTMRELVQFLDRQRVHVGAQTDRARGRAVTQCPDHARAAQPAGDCDAPFGELGGHQVRRTIFLKAQFGMGVDVAPDLLDLGAELDNAVD